jgi:hypothetical protein
MALTLTVPDDLERAATELAGRCGMSPEDVLLTTLRNNIMDIPPELRDEMAMWELASELDIAKVEREHGLE